MVVVAVVMEKGSEVVRMGAATAAGMKAADVMVAATAMRIHEYRSQGYIGYRHNRQYWRRLRADNQLVGSHHLRDPLQTRNRGKLVHTECKAPDILQQFGQCT